jgi:acetolactate synthase I/II/III large subunit
MKMNGAQVLVDTLVDSGVDTCFANPGTSEMHFVAALDRVPGMRCVLGLFEGVVTGAADGYYRLTDRPAGTLLHLGPGLGNGLANLHNAKKARSGIVNIVGEHATEHLALDAPLTSDIAAVAAPMSNWVGTVASADSIASDGREAVAQALGPPGRVATLILPADKAWSEVTSTATRLGRISPAPFAASDESAQRAAAEVLRKAGPSTLVLLGGRAVRSRVTTLAGRLAAATGCSVMSEFYAPRIERGAGRVAVPRVPYAVDPARDILGRFRHIVLVGAAPPVAFFAYPGKPGRLSAPETGFIELSSPAHDHEEALAALCDALGANRAMPATCGLVAASPALEEGPVTPASIGALLATLIPENAIVVDEAISTGRAFDAATRDAAPHDWLTNMGGSIGYGLPVAVGAAIGAPGRKVIALEGDGSAMYTPQALWSMARESLDVTVVIFANRSYQILRGEFAHVGAGAPGQRATDMLTIDRPALDWVALSTGMGVPACKATTLREFAAAMRKALAAGGPGLIELVL